MATAQNSRQEVESDELEYQLNQEIPLEILRHVCDEDPLKGSEDKQALLSIPELGFNPQNNYLMTVFP